MIKEFDPLIYPRKLWISIDATQEELKEYFNTDVEPLDDTNIAIAGSCHKELADGKTFGGILIQFQDVKNNPKGIITHESFHAACDIFDYIGAFVDSKNQEPFAYLAGWVSKCAELTIEEFLKNEV